MKNSIQNIKIVALAVALSLGLNIVYAWVAPTAAPPGGNADSPITTAAVEQTKKAGMIFRGNVVLESGDPSEPAVIVTKGLVLLDSSGTPLPPGKVLTTATPIEEIIDGKKRYTTTGIVVTDVVAGGVEPIFDELIAIPSTVDYGKSSIIKWKARNVTSCSTLGGVSALWPNTSRPIEGSQDLGNLFNVGSGLYEIKCSGASGSITKLVEVVVSAPAAPTATLNASSYSVPYGGSTVLTWSSTNATSCTGNWGTSITTAGSATIANITTGPGIYRVKCLNVSGAEVTSSPDVIITVGSAPVAPTPPSVTSLTASPANVAYNGSTNLSWTATNATQCSLSGVGAPTSFFPPSSNQPINNITTSPRDYTITCTGASGTAPATRTVTVTVPAPVVTAFVIEPSSVNYGGSTTLKWTSTNTGSCALSGSQSASGLGTSATFPINNITTSPRSYTITCTGVNGSTASRGPVTVTVKEPTVSLKVVTYDGSDASVDFYWSSTNATSCTAKQEIITTTYIKVARGGPYTISTQGRIIWSGSKPLSSQETGVKYSGAHGIDVSDAKYTLSCTGPSGTKDAILSVPWEGGTKTYEVTK